MTIDRHEPATLLGSSAMSAALHIIALAAVLGLGIGRNIPAEPLSMVVEVVVLNEASVADEAPVSDDHHATSRPSSESQSASTMEAAPPASTPIQTADAPIPSPTQAQVVEPSSTPAKPVDRGVAPASPAPKRVKRAPPQASQAIDAKPAAAAQEPPTVVPPQPATQPHSGPGTGTTQNAEAMPDENAGGFQSSAAALVANPAPSYPPLARRRGLEGKVVLLVAVTTNGTAGDISVLSSSGHESLDAAAARAVRTWRFRPALHRGSPVDSKLEIPIVFRLVTGDTPPTTLQAGAAE